MGNTTDVTVRLRGESGSYTAAVLRARAANDAMINSARGVSRGLTAIDGPLSGITARFDAAKSIVSGSAGVYATFGAVLAGSAVYMGSAISKFTEYEQHQLTTQQLLKSTGYAAGLSAQQLEENARNVALNTLASVSEIQAAQDVLLTFKSVQRDVFLSAIGLAKDMAVVFGGDAKDKANQLGKALESPTKGISALARSGVTFTVAQADMIKKMEMFGRKAEAQRYILKTLEDQLGGAAQAQATGTAGAADTLGQRWDELQLKMAKLGPATAAKNIMNDLANVLYNVAEQIEPSIGTLEKRIASLQSTINRSQRGGAGARARRSAYITEQLAELNDELLIAKARAGDATAINKAFSDTSAAIAELETQLANAPAKKQIGRGGLAVKSDESAALEQQIADQKIRLAELQSLADQNRKIEKGFADQAAANAAPVASTATTKTKTKTEPGAIFGYGYSEVQAGLTAMKSALDQAMQQEIAAQLSRQDYIDAAMLDGYIGDEEWHRLTEENFRLHQENLTKIQKEESEKRARSEAEAQALMYSTMGDALGQATDLLSDTGNERTALFKTAFAAQKAAAIPSMVTSTEQGATAALALGPIAGPVASTAIRTLGYASIGVVAGQTIAGIAHGGLGYVPDEATYLLQRGEGVLSPKQNSAVQQAANRINSGSTAPVINVIEDASKAGTVETARNNAGGYTTSVFVASIRQGGDEAAILENTYGLQRVGR